MNRPKWDVGIRGARLWFAMGVVTVVLVAATPASAGASHRVFAEPVAGGIRIVSTVTSDANSRVDWEYFELANPNGRLGKADSAYTTKQRPSVTSTHLVPCPEGAGEWQVHVQVHGGRTGAGRLLFSDTWVQNLQCT